MLNNTAVLHLIDHTNEIKMLGLVAKHGAILLNKLNVIKEVLMCQINTFLKLSLSVALKPKQKYIIIVHKYAQTISLSPGKII